MPGVWWRTPLAVEGGVVEGKLLGVTLHDRALEPGGREVGGGDLDVAGSQVDTGRNRAGAGVANKVDSLATADVEDAHAAGPRVSKDFTGPGRVVAPHLVEVGEVLGGGDLDVDLGGAAGAGRPLLDRGGLRAVRLDRVVQQLVHRYGAEARVRKVVLRSPSVHGENSLTTSSPCLLELSDQPPDQAVRPAVRRGVPTKERRPLWLSHRGHGDRVAGEAEATFSDQPRRPSGA